MATGKLQRAILDSLGRAEVEDYFGGRVQYRLVRDVVVALYETLSAPTDPRSPVPHAFDVAVRRAMRTLESRGRIRMEPMSLYPRAKWACWLPAQAGPPTYPRNPETVVGIEVRRAILDYIAGPVRQFSYMEDAMPPDPLGHRYDDARMATAAKLRHDPFSPQYRTAFSRAVRRLFSERRVLYDEEEVAGRKIIRHINPTPGGGVELLR